MATSSPAQSTDVQPLVLSLGAGFVATAAVFVTSLQSLWLQTFTLTPASGVPWGFWASVVLALLSFTGMMGSLFAIDEWRAEA